MHSSEPPGDAFQALIQHETLIKGCLTAILGNSHLLQDAISQTKVEIVATWDQYDSNRPAGFWVCGIARRVAYQMLRREAAERLVLVSEAAAQLSDSMAEEPAGNQGHIEMVSRCVNRLPGGQRQVIILRFYEELSHQELARLFNRTTQALYCQTSRLLDILRQCMERELQS